MERFGLLSSKNLALLPKQKKILFCLKRPNLKHEFRTNIRDPFQYDIKFTIVNVCAHYSELGYFNQTWANDHLRIATTCLKRPLFWSPDCGLLTLTYLWTTNNCLKFGVPRVVVFKSLTGLPKFAINDFFWLSLQNFLPKKIASVHEASFNKF